MSGTDETTVDAPHARRGVPPRSEAVRAAAELDAAASRALVASAPGPEHLPAGTQVGEYTLGPLLGAGACGAVYRATHTIIGKAAAIKVLNARFTHDDHMVTRFVEEARAVNRIGHPDIIDIFGFGALPDGRHYSVMEFLSGETLGQRLLRGPLSLAETLRVLQPVARALDAAHAAGVAHRDVKPENIFLQRNDDTTRTRLLDFGIAKLNVDGDSPTDTGTGATVGTPSYMAPEQCVGKHVDHRADIYAFGVVVYECLSGRRPYEEDSRYLMMAAHIHQPFPLLHTVLDVPAPVDDALRVIAAKDPAARPTSVMDAWRLLEAASSAQPLRRSTLAGVARRHAVAVVVGALVTCGGVVAWRARTTADNISPATRVAPVAHVPSAPPLVTSPVSSAVTSAVTSAVAPSPPSAAHAPGGALIPPKNTSPSPTTPSTPARPSRQTPVRSTSSAPTASAAPPARSANDENQLEEWQ